MCVCVCVCVCVCHMHILIFMYSYVAAYYAEMKTVAKCILYITTYTRVCMYYVSQSIKIYVACVYIISL